MVTRKYSLNSKAAGNLDKKNKQFIYNLSDFFLPFILPVLTLVLAAYLPGQLPDTVNELNKNRWSVCICVVFITMADALAEREEDIYDSCLVTSCKEEKILLLPAGSDDQSSATLSPAAPRSHEWCGSNHPAWAWTRRWAELCGPSRRCSAPPRRSSPIPLCLRSWALQPGSTESTPSLYAWHA